MGHKCNANEIRPAKHSLWDQIWYSLIKFYILLPSNYYHQGINNTLCINNKMTKNIIKSLSNIKTHILNN